MLPPASERYRIRPGLAEDAATLADIESKAFDPQHYAGMMLSARDFRRHAGSRNALLVCEDLTAGGAVCGYALGFVKRTSPYVRFVSLAIRPEHGGRGAGRLLFEAIEDFARRNAYRGVRLEVREDNTRLRDRYLRLGYRVFATVPDYYPDGAAAVRMVKDLAP
jgi:ribosomal protein S18 acetylase RimI-like enzyme